MKTQINIQLLFIACIMVVLPCLVSAQMTTGILPQIKTPNRGGDLADVRSISLFGRNYGGIVD
jgi:hypothetical protein